MLPNPQQCHALASEWINAFNQSLAAAPQSPDAAAHLFLTDSYWRDALGVTWQLDTMVGGDAIVTALRENATRVGLSDLSLDDTASPPQWVNRAGTDAIEAFSDLKPKPPLVAASCGCAQQPSQPKPAIPTDNGVHGHCSLPLIN